MNGTLSILINNFKVNCNQETMTKNEKKISPPLRFEPLELKASVLPVPMPMKFKQILQVKYFQN